jgi:hypothetical protein
VPLYNKFNSSRVTTDTTLERVVSVHGDQASAASPMGNLLPWEVMVCVCAHYYGVITITFLQTPLAELNMLIFSKDKSLFVSFLV